jgi:predicted Holliday junction resolvase-like endonuclease
VKNEVGELLGQFSWIMAICPFEECGQLFRLSDARPYLKDKRPHSVLDDIEAQDERLDRAIARLAEQESLLRAEAKSAGLKKAKTRLRKIDPVFSGSRLDPQDVKIIFDPVEYVVFDGMNRENLRRILLLGHEPTSKEDERVLKSIAHAIGAGNMSFNTLRVLEDGTLQLK